MLHQTFNIGNDTEPISMKHLAERIIHLSGKELTVKLIDMKNSDRTNEREIIKRIPDISKAKRILRYSPKISLDEGLKTILYKR